MYHTYEGSQDAPDPSQNRPKASKRAPWRPHRAPEVTESVAEYSRRV